MTENSEPDLDVVEAWRCVGLGRIEAPEPYIGVCEDGLGRRASQRALRPLDGPAGARRSLRPAMRLLDRSVGHERA